MTLETAVAPTESPSQQGNAFAHPRLADVLKRASAGGGVGALLIQLISDLVNPQDTVLCCYASLEMGAGAASAGSDANTFYAINVALVTSAYFINIELMPKTHSYRKRKIHTIADIQVRYDPPGPDELRSVQPGKFSPSNISLSIVFADERGSVVDTWSIESTHPEQVRYLHEIARISSRCVGFPLAKIPVARPTSG